jgi:hypothetical protein
MGTDLDEEAIQRQITKAQEYTVEDVLGLRSFDV